MSDLLVTGGTGLIGRQVLSMLAGRHRVWAIARRAVEERHPAVTWLRHDLAASELPRALPPRIDTVIHLAQSTHFREFPEHAFDIFEVNVGSTMRLLEWARSAGATRFIYASSGGIYGGGEKEFVEDDHVGGAGDLGFYLASKHCAELLVRSYADHFLIAILRFSFVYGAGQRHSMLIPRLVRMVAEGQPIRLQGPDGIKIVPTHVRDAATAIVRCLDLEQSHNINVGGPDTLFLRQVAEIIGERLGREPVFAVETDAAANHLHINTEKMRHLLGPAELSLRDGVADVIDDLRGELGAASAGARGGSPTPA